MESFYALDLEHLRGRSGGEIVREMRAAVGKAKRTARGEALLTGIVLGRQGEKMQFCFRLKHK